MKHFIKETTHNIAISGLYLASFSAILFLGIFAMDSSMETNNSSDFSEEAVTQNVKTNFELKTTWDEITDSNEENNNPIIL